MALLRAGGEEIKRSFVERTGTIAVGVTNDFQSEQHTGVSHAPRGFGQEAGAVPKVADGQGHPSRLSGVAGGAVKRPPVVPRDVACTAEDEEEKSVSASAVSTKSIELSWAAAKRSSRRSTKLLSAQHTWTKKCRFSNIYAEE